MRTAPRPTVILSTYNQPAWLEKSLWGYAVQTHRDFELVIADDGSGPETQALIERLRRELGLDLVHVWHEDRGFRKTVILNKAILAATGDYLIFSDGDCIPRADFVATHLRLARAGHFLSGDYIRFAKDLSERVSIDDVRAGRFASPTWLVRHGFREWKKLPRLTGPRPLAALYDLVTTVPVRFNGNNVSVWRDAMFAINGFDMRMGWGQEDHSAGWRLMNLGLRGLQIRNRLPVFHLWHERPYVTPDMLERNRAIVARLEASREVRAPYGLDELSVAEADAAAAQAPADGAPTTLVAPPPSGAPRNAADQR